MNNNILGRALSSSIRDSIYVGRLDHYDMDGLHQRVFIELLPRLDSLLDKRLSNYLMSEIGDRMRYMNNKVEEELK